MIEHVEEENCASPHPTIQHDQNFVNQRRIIELKNLGSWNYLSRKSKKWPWGVAPMVLLLGIVDSQIFLISTTFPGLQASGSI